MDTSNTRAKTVAFVFHETATQALSHVGEKSLYHDFHATRSYLMDQLFVSDTQKCFYILFLEIITVPVRHGQGCALSEQRPRLMLAVSPFNVGLIAEERGQKENGNKRTPELCNSVTVRVSFFDYTHFRRLGGSRCLSFLARN